MLRQLEIHNIALIDKVNIELGEGLNILTGETGAGKSIIIDSINAILGERVSKELIRHGTEKACVEAVFQIDQNRFEALAEKYGIEPEEDGTFIISREFSVSGKNTCRINGKMATVSMLKEIGEIIIDVHGQHDNQSLLRTEKHIELLDLFGGKEVLSLKSEYQKLLEEYRGIKQKIRGLSGEKNDRERKIDLLKYQIDEIKKAKLKKSEDEELNKQRVLLGSAEKIINSLTSSYDYLFEGGKTGRSASESLGKALLELGSIARLDEKFENIQKRLEDISYQLDDLIEEIRKERDGIDYSPELLEQVDERIDVIFKLKRKYGATVEEVLEYCKKTENELEELLSSEKILNELYTKLSEIEKKLYDYSAKINFERNKAAKLLESEISIQLEDLEMKRSKFKVEIIFDEAVDGNGERKYNANGLDKVEFLISPNVGEQLKPLSKIASGGEMSRIMLAIKTILADVDKMPTLIFDEIDIGVSGKAAQKVGEKLSFLSKKHQVICVTHLTQIASMADHHYLIEKETVDESTKTSVNLLSDEKQKAEIARILGGANISDITLKHAEEVLENARKFKLANQK